MPYEETAQSREAVALTSRIMHQYYCEQDIEGVNSLLDEELLWLGTGEQECAVGGETVKQLFRQFAGQVPKCNISGEEYHVLEVGPESWVCMGRLWIETDPSTDIFMRVHQRITTVFRRKEGRLRCCHIHISNPYGEMSEEDVGLPTRMAEETSRYLHEQIEVQKRQLANQTEQLRRMSYEDLLTGLHNQNRFNEVRSGAMVIEGDGLGVACLDLNGLKEINDRQGHSAGDDMLRRTAEQMRRVFPQRVYRTGGDELVIVDGCRSESAFYEAVEALRSALAQVGISCSVGGSWRPGNGDIREQYDEADLRMYQEKRAYYSTREHDRRNRR